MSTIKDVARRANVSVTTVSRVLNNNGYVHHDTKRIIEEAMNELKYSPNIFASNLSKGSTNTIGIIVKYITNPNSSKLIDIIEKECMKKRIKVIIGITRDSKVMEDYYLNMFKKHNVDGLILLDKVIDTNSFIELDKPTISIDYKINENTSSITIDYNDGIANVCNYLIKEQKNNILIIKYANRECKSTNDLSKLLDKNNINKTFIELDEDFTKEELLTILNEIQFDSIYTTCDIIAISTISSLNKLKIKVPDVCSVIGNSNISFSSIITPSLTSLDYPSEEIGLNAFEVIYNNIINNEKGVVHKTVITNLVKRESTI